MSKMSISGVVVEVGRKPDLPGVALRVKETVESEFGAMEIVHTVLCDVDDGVQVGEVVRGYGLVEWIPPGVIGSVSVPELKRPQQKPAGGYNRSSGNRQQANRWNNRRDVPSANSNGSQGGNRNYSQGQSKRSAVNYEQSRQPRQSRPVEEIDPSQFKGQPHSGQAGTVRATDGDINLSDRHRQPQSQSVRQPQPQSVRQSQPQQQSNHDAQVLDQEVERSDYGTEERCSHYEEVLPASSGSFKINTKTGW